jgi:rhamnogalacturonyl hydrolase YesR
MKNIACSILLLFISLLTGAQSISLKQVFKDAESQTQLMLKEIPQAKEKDNQVVPRTYENGKLKIVSSRDWTSGFFPGVLWFLYEYTHKKEWKAEAENYTALLEREKANATNHDIGFRIYCSYGNAYRLTGDSNYKAVIIEAAKTLTKRFNETAGVIKSWDGRTEWAYPVIVDNMMNLELLFAATRFSGDSSFYRVAVSHAKTTMKNHFRADNSSYHVLDYDTVTGNVVAKQTHQGYSDASAWARGQAWGLYGFTVCYRETKDTSFLMQAERIASFILNHPRLPKDMVPYWDYDVPALQAEPRDASAAAITASALYELSTYSKNKKLYRKSADVMLKSLTQNYRSPVGENKGFLLIHSTGHKPANSEIDVPLNYADYYFLEALLRSRNNKK